MECIVPGPTGLPVIVGPCLSIKPFRERNEWTTNPIWMSWWMSEWMSVWERSIDEGLPNSQTTPFVLRLTNMSVQMKAQNVHHPNDSLSTSTWWATYWNGFATDQTTTHSHTLFFNLWIYAFDDLKGNTCGDSFNLTHTCSRLDLSILFTLLLLSLWVKQTYALDLIYFQKKYIYILILC